MGVGFPALKSSTRANPPSTGGRGPVDRLTSSRTDLQICLAHHEFLPGLEAEKSQINNKESNAKLCEAVIGACICHQNESVLL